MCAHIHLYIHVHEKVLLIHVRTHGNILILAYVLLCIDLHPSTWDPMPTDSNGKEVTCHVVELDSSSQEFREVEGKFNRTMQRGGLPMHGVWYPHQGVCKIKRIQNPTLYSQYVARKKVMEQKYPDLEVEKRLFHGCASDTVDKINHGGFNRSYAGKNGMYIHICFYTVCVS